MPRKKTVSVDFEKVVAVATEGLTGVAQRGEVGDFLPVTEADGVWTARAKALQPGYPGWLWTVSVTESEGGHLSVTEVNLLPGDDALLSPEWIPWSDRLEEYRRVEAEREATQLHDAESDAEGDDDIDDADDLDDVLDGIDIDQLDIDLDPTPLEVQDPPNDVFDHVDIDDHEED